MIAVRISEEYPVMEADILAAAELEQPRFTAARRADQMHVLEPITRGNKKRHLLLVTAEHNGIGWDAHRHAGWPQRRMCSEQLLTHG